ncbi:tudor domain-containing protein 10 [Bufo bufo]|uniref:tudor domain-containing protein 10 n=1 Tax=Bufo bufo TaxID=8384 RepID=UPI001ABE0FBF|nr:tudor domain-containing protein 10 [Bufo bufo]
MNPGKTSREADPCQIYVGNLPCDTTEDEILIFFKDYNPVNVKRVQKNQKCFAFIQLSSVENATQAIAKLHKSVLRSRTLVLRRFSVQYNEKLEPQMKERRDDQIFVSNLPFDVSEVDLHELFQDFNPLKIKILTKETYSFAFLTMANIEVARMAVHKMHGFMFRGQHMSCKVHFDAKHPRKDSGIAEDPADTPISVVKSKPSENETPISPGNGENRIYVDNLPTDATKEDLLLLFKRYRPVSVRREPHLEIRLGIVEVNTSDDVMRAVSHLNGTMFKGSRLRLASVTSSRRLSENATSPPPGPALDGTLNYEDCKAVKENVVTAKNLLLIPVEMRGSFLAAMLKGCFQDLSWLAGIMNTRGELSLLVTNTYLCSQYFWAVPVREETYNTLSDICTRLVQAEPQLPCVTKDDVRRGTRCLAQCVLAEEDGTWSRCWVADVAGDAAVVFFLDYGVTDVIPINSLRTLDDDQYWSAPPMAQPFLLRQGPEVSRLIGTVLRGRTSGSCSREQHIQKFCTYPNED